MPSKSLVSSWTTSFVVPSGTRSSHSPARKAYPGRLSTPRIRVLKHLHGLWKGTSSPRNVQLASGPKLRRVSSTISTPGVTLVSRPSPTPSPLTLFSPPSPTTSPTLASLPSVTDTDLHAIRFSSKVEPGTMPFRHFRSLSPLSPPQDAELSLDSESSYSSSTVSSLRAHSPTLTCVASSTSLAAVCGSGSTLDAATRLQDFRALIEEMRATLLHHDSTDSEEIDVRDCGGGGDNDDDDDERERLLRLLEDVMRKVKRLAEKDTAGPVTMTDAAP